MTDTFYKAINLFSANKREYEGKSDNEDMRWRGIGQSLVKQAIAVAPQHSIEWLHVDYEPHLHDFYQQCGFEPTEAGIKRLSIPSSRSHAKRDAKRGSENAQVI